MAFTVEATCDGVKPSAAAFTTSISILMMGAALAKEEEANATDLIAKMELFGSDPKGLYMLNSELAARAYSAPSLVL